MKPAHKAAIMENNDIVNCPLCEGLAKMRRSHLVALLAGNNLRDKLEMNMAEVTQPAEKDQPGRRLQPGEFGREVHNWNPTLSLWRRSPKE
jgi:hypothetical protein